MTLFLISVEFFFTIFHGKFECSASILRLLPSSLTPVFQIFPFCYDVVLFRFSILAVQHMYPGSVTQPESHWLRFPNRDGFVESSCLNCQWTAQRLPLLFAQVQGAGRECWWSCFPVGKVLGHLGPAKSCFPQCRDGIMLLVHDGSHCHLPSRPHTALHHKVPSHQPESEYRKSGLYMQALCKPLWSPVFF